MPKFPSLPALPSGLADIAARIEAWEPPEGIAIEATATPSHLTTRVWSVRRPACWMADHFFEGDNPEATGRRLAASVSNAELMAMNEEAREAAGVAAERKAAEDAALRVEVVELRAEVVRLRTIIANLDKRRN